ncbi:MAG: DUF6029 family protein [Prolixibacteraceae bacterium]|jgi:hypothetical protein|nr:DUF6029 family protein [Prolixibacteraceae bacterium]
MNKLLKYTFIIVAVTLSFQVKAQFSANNIVEVQRGNLPGSEPADLLTLYDQLDLKYRYKAFIVSTRIEQFHTSGENRYEYFRLNQLSATYRKRGLEIKLGNDFETLGRGLLLRGYEIKNYVFEDRIYRSKQGFYKDIQGASARYRIRQSSCTFSIWIQLFIV